MKLGQKIDHRTLAMAQEGNRCQCLHCNDLLHVFRSLTAHNPEDNGTLRVTNIVQLRIARFIEHIVNCAGYIVHAHLMESKVPELGVMMRVLDVLARVRIAPHIGHPHIVALLVE